MRSTLLLMLALAACGGASTPHEGAIEVALGTANLDGTGFLPLVGDQTLVPGAQGGFHIWVLWKVATMPPQKIHALRTVRRVSDNALILTTEAAQEVGAADDTGWWQLPSALPSFMCPTPIGVKVQDQTVKFDLTLKADHNGEPGDTLAETTATATPRCPTDDQQQFCENICDG